jgi:hypothetical protein
MTISVASILSSYGSVVSYDNALSTLVLKLTDTTAKSRSLTITGFKTYQSTKPIVYTVELLYQDFVYFHFSSAVAIPNPKQVATIFVSTSSPVVYAINSVTMTLSELSVGDIITYSTSDYSNFLLPNLFSSCDSSIASCNIDGSLALVSVNNADAALQLTRLTFPLRNSHFLGKPTFSLTVFDSTRNYLKQITTFILDVSQMNYIPSEFISYASSNPYFR